MDSPRDSLCLLRAPQSLCSSHSLVYSSALWTRGWEQTQRLRVHVGDTVNPEDGPLQSPVDQGTGTDIGIEGVAG